MCCIEKRAVVASTATTTQAADPVVLTVDRPLPTGCPFYLCIPKGLLVNVTTGTVNVSDGGTTYELFNKRAEQVRYDSVVAYGRTLGEDVCGMVRLRCLVGTDAAFRVLVCTRLPSSCYLAVPTAG